MRAPGSDRKEWGGLQPLPLELPGYGRRPRPGGWFAIGILAREYGGESGLGRGVAP